MTNKNIIIPSIVLLVVALGAGAMYLYSKQMPLQSSTNTTTSINYNPKTQGKVIFGITDDATDMNGVSSVFITVDKIEVHSAGAGWVTVLSETKQYDLLALKKSGVVSLLASANVGVGSYDQVRLMVNKVVVVKNGVSAEAKLPSGELKIMGNIVVNADKTASVVFDFMADKSLHMMGDGKFIFAPVIKIQRQDDATVGLAPNGELNIKGGSRQADENVGMDEKGEVKDNFELNGKLNIDKDNNIQIENNIQSHGETNGQMVFNFSAQNNSGVSGTATLSEDNGKVKVVLNVKSGVLGFPAPAEPAHIHVGACPNVGEVKYPLNSVVNGKSETTINTSLANLKAQLPLAINVHKSVAEANVYIACTNLSF